MDRSLDRVEIAAHEPDRRILRRWYAQNRYGNVTTADFIALSERVSGQQLDDLFDAWLYEEGRPAVCDV